MKYTFKKIKDRAKERGHQFLLTLEEFRSFVERTGYMDGKGKTAQSLSIDRIRPDEGYHSENIRVLTLSINSRLRNAPLEVCEKYAAFQSKH